MKRLMIVAAAAALLASPATASPLTEKFSGLAVFGDSLSDDGNLTAPFAPPSPPYFMGQFSNGPVALDILAREFAPGRSVNYANGGARTVDTTPVDDLPEQLVAFGNEAPDLGARPLVSFWFGANDVLAALQTLAVDLAAIPAGTPPEVAAALQGAAFAKAGAAAQSAAQNVVAAVAGVSGRGFDDFLVFKLPDLGLTPRSIAAGAQAVIAATALSTAFNAVLSAGLDAIEGPGTRIVRIDIPSEFARVAELNGPLGLTNVTESCFTPDPFSICGRPGSYLFWDGVHPTAVVHAELARVVEAALIPLPGTLPLLAGGFLAAGLLVRRRAA